MKNKTNLSQTIFFSYNVFFSLLINKLKFYVLKIFSSFSPKPYWKYMRYFARQRKIGFFSFFFISFLVEVVNHSALVRLKGTFCLEAIFQCFMVKKIVFFRIDLKLIVIVKDGMNGIKYDKNEAYKFQEEINLGSSLHLCPNITRSWNKSKAFLRVVFHSWFGKNKKTIEASYILSMY